MPVPAGDIAGYGMNFSNLESWRKRKEILPGRGVSSWELIADFDVKPPPQRVWPWSWKWWQLQRHGVNASSSPKSVPFPGLILEVWINFLLFKVTVKMKLASGLLGQKSLLIALPFASGPIKLHLCRLAALGAAWVSSFFLQYRVSLLSWPPLILVLFRLTRVLQQKE